MVLMFSFLKLIIISNKDLKNCFILSPPLVLQVKIRNWMNNNEVTELVGVSARFGEKISDTNVALNAIPLAMPSLVPSCNTSSIPVRNSLLYADLIYVM